VLTYLIAVTWFPGRQKFVLDFVGGSKVTPTALEDLVGRAGSAQGAECIQQRPEIANEPAHLRLFPSVPSRCGLRAPSVADETGVARGNNWARNFMRGMPMRRDGWAELVDDEEHGGCRVPRMMLCHEHHQDRRCGQSRCPQRSAKSEVYWISITW
jgi:hypothetical protein